MLFILMKIKMNMLKMGESILVMDGLHCQFLVERKGSRLTTDIGKLTWTFVGNSAQYSGRCGLMFQNFVEILMYGTLLNYCLWS